MKDRRDALIDILARYHGKTSLGEEADAITALFAEGPAAARELSRLRAGADHDEEGSRRVLRSFGVEEIEDVWCVHPDHERCLPIGSLHDALLRLLALRAGTAEAEEPSGVVDCPHCHLRHFAGQWHLCNGVRREWEPRVRATPEAVPTAGATVSFQIGSKGKIQRCYRGDDGEWTSDGVPLNSWSKALLDRIVELEAAPPSSRDAAVRALGEAAFAREMADSEAMMCSECAKTDRGTFFCDEHATRRRNSMNAASIAVQEIMDASCPTPPPAGAER